jgi:NarL family two-component system response regulator LiaR
MIRIVIATGPSMTHRLRALLESDPQFRVVGETNDVRELVQLVVTNHPDILLFDINTPHGSALDVLEQVAASAPTVRTLIITEHVDGVAMMRFLRAGARGVVVREDTTPVLFKSIRRVMQGEHWLDQGKLALLIEEMRRVPTPSVPPPNRFNLTPRELDVVAAVVAGESNREIATRLTIREDTVKHH